MIRTASRNSRLALLAAAVAVVLGPAPGAAQDTHTVAHHRDWSVYCAELCWIATAAHEVPGLLLTTALRPEGRVETSIVSTGPGLDPDADVVLRSGVAEMRLVVDGGAAFVPREAWERPLAGTFIEGASAEVRVDGRPRVFSLSGYTAAFADAHERSGRAFSADSYIDEDGALVINVDDDPPDPQPQPEPEPAPEPLPETDVAPSVDPATGPVPAAGCSDAEIEAEAARIEVAARARAGGSGAGTAVLAAEYHSSQMLALYRRCYRPAFAPVTPTSRPSTSGPSNRRLTSA